MEVPANVIGRRILVIGTAGARKTTFATALSSRRGLPVVHLDLHYWRPGWVRPSEDEWREQQQNLLSGDAWIAEGNYLGTLDLRLERAQDVILLEAPWVTCARRAFLRGIKRPAGWRPPAGCDDLISRRLRDEWGLVIAICRDRGAEMERARAIVAEGKHEAVLHVLGSNEATGKFLAHLQSTTLADEG
ncbi:MAG TPA: hypothetical protein VFN61_12900 [Acidimicrobiales bacterium]|nr:hypothetical protein [Acidimicrobiales bacterium]